MSNDNVRPDAPTILFVEDEPNMRSLVEKVFRDKGYRIFTAANGIKALEILINTTPDLIVSDIMMPEMDGVEFFKNVLERYGENRPVFMFLTAKTDEEDIVAGLSMGAEDYITKPVSIRQLALKIEARLKRIEAQKRHLATGLRGNLEDQGVADIIQFIELAEHTGRLTVTYRNREGQIHFSKGHIHWADFTPLRGMDAVYALIALQTGTFRFDSTDDIVDTNRIKVDNYALILEAMKRIDEQGRDKILESVMDAGTVSIADIPGSDAPETPEPALEPPEDAAADTGQDVVADVMPEPVSQPGLPGSESTMETTQEIPLQKDPSEPQDLSATVEEPLEPLVIPEWFGTVDFEAIKTGLSELETGSFIGRWLDTERLPSAIEDLNTEPGCIIISTAEVLTRIFQVLSEFFYMAPPTEDACPMVTADLDPDIPFRIMGYPLDRATPVPHELKAHLTILYLLDEYTDTLGSHLKALYGSIHPVHAVVFSDMPEEISTVLDTEFPGTFQTVQAGSLTSWLGILFSLSKAMTAFKAMRDNRQR